PFWVLKKMFAERRGPLKRKVRLQTRLILWMTALLTSVVGMMGFLFYGILVDAVEEQIGKRALRLAKTVAADPERREAFSRGEPRRHVQPIAERARISSGAEFVVVGNEHGRGIHIRFRNGSERRWSAGTTDRSSWRESPSFHGRWAV